MSIHSRGEAEVVKAVASLAECPVPEPAPTVRQQLNFDSFKTPSDQKTLGGDYQNLIGSSGAKSLKFEEGGGEKPSSEKKNPSPDDTFLIGCEHLSLVHSPRSEQCEPGPRQVSLTEQILTMLQEQVVVAGSEYSNLITPQQDANIKAHMSQIQSQELSETYKSALLKPDDAGLTELLLSLKRNCKLSEQRIQQGK